MRTLGHARRERSSARAVVHADISRLQGHAQEEDGDATMTDDQARRFDQWQDGLTVNILEQSIPAIAIYPIKALARDQVIRWQSMAEAAGLDPESINRIDGDVRDLTERRQILQRTRLA